MTDRWGQPAKGLGGPKGVSALDYLLGNAVGQNHMERAEWLLERGADPDAPSVYTGQPPLVMARLSGFLEMAALLPTARGQGGGDDRLGGLPGGMSGGGSRGGRGPAGRRSFADRQAGAAVVGGGARQCGRCGPAAVAGRQGRWAWLTMASARCTGRCSRGCWRWSSSSSRRERTWTCASGAGTARR
ncbi:MAG: ankyrin repeat domain-containing protein [Caulobacteraceae bacterium]